MTQYSIARRAQDPLSWHLHYWLSISVIGILRGEDNELMGFRIEMEHSKMNPLMQAGFRTAWDQYWRQNIEECQRYWEVKTVDSDEAIWYMRDIDAMLEHKVQKASNYLCRKGMLMLNALQATRLEDARVLFEKIITVHTKLQEEARRHSARIDAARDAEARNQLPEGTDGVPDQGEQGIEAIEAALVRSGHMWDDEKKRL